MALDCDEQTSGDAFSGVMGTTVWFIVFALFLCVPATALSEDVPGVKQSQYHSEGQSTETTRSLPPMGEAPKKKPAKTEG